MVRVFVDDDRDTDRARYNGAVSSTSRGGRANAGGAPDVAALSPRRREVLHLIARGLTNDEIGHTLAISTGTVRTHVAAILVALDVTNRTEAAAVYQGWDASPPRVDEVLARPALAILPIETVDGRGVGEAVALQRDLVALCSRWCWFPVIASAATRDARTLGGPDAIGRALGARFLLDGALRVGPRRWRLHVELVDAETSRCLIAERYEFAARELFAAQDRVCEAVVAAAYDRLIGCVLTQPAPSEHPDGVATWRLAHWGLGLQARRERAANLDARTRLRAALAREPTLSLAHYGLGLAAYDAVLNQWCPRAEALDELTACAERATALAPDQAEGHYLQARLHQALGRHDRAAAPLRIAIANNPSFAAAHALLGQNLLLTGDRGEGLARLQHACRLGPRAFVAGLAVGHFICAAYQPALDAAERAVAAAPRYPFARAIAAAAAWHLGQVAVARGHVAALRTLHADFAPARFAETFGGDVDAVARIAAALAAVEHSA